MKNLSLVVPCLVLLLVVGCATQEATRVDTGPVRASTFSFIPRGSRPVPPSADDREEVHAAIQAAITRHLAAKGVRHVESGGDVVVAYLIVVGDQATTQAINDYFGYGRSYAALHAKAHEAYTSGERPDLVEAGTLLIDVIDPRALVVVKRTHVTRPLLRDPSPAARTAYVQTAVDEALRDLVIGK